MAKGVTPRVDDEHEWAGKPVPTFQWHVDGFLLCGCSFELFTASPKPAESRRVFSVPWICVSWICAKRPSAVPSIDSSYFIVAVLITAALKH
jgi:hypothetical protein